MNELGYRAWMYRNVETRYSAGSGIAQSAAARRSLAMAFIGFFLEIVHLQPQATLRLDSKKSTNLNLPVWVRNLKPEPSDQRRQQTLHLQPRKALPDAAPRPMQEREERIRALRSPGCCVGTLEPSVWIELVRVSAPESTTSIDGPRSYCGEGALGNVHAADCRWNNGVTGCDGRGRVEAQCFVADGCKEGHVLRVED